MTASDAAPAPALRRAEPLVLWLLAVAVALALFARAGALRAGIGYVLAMVAITACSALCLRRQPIRRPDIPDPARQSAWLLAFAGMSWCLAALNFTLWADKSGWPVWTKLALLAGFVLLPFQGATVAYLWRRGTRGAAAWGFNPRQAWVALPAIVIMGLCSVCSRPRTRRCCGRTCPAKWAHGPTWC